MPEDINSSHAQRPSRNAPVIIAIDGPAGSGKSTVAAAVAKQFGLLNLETGAMYRALALKALQQGIAVDDAATVTSLTRTTSILLEPEESGNRVLLDGVDVTSMLRSAEITGAASHISVHPEVRSWMVAEQRAMSVGMGRGVVMEGRDIGTVVFPEATVKVFLDASVEARGGRRFQQQTGVAVAKESVEAITREIAERDARDRTRESSPLRAAPDAVLIDTTSLPLEAVLQQVSQLVELALHSAVSE